MMKMGDCGFGEKIEKVLEKHNRRVEKERALFRKLSPTGEPINILDLIPKKEKK